MKKIYILIAWLAIGMTACQVEEDSMFDESSTERMNRMIAECDAMLQKPEHGWRMVYVPNPTKHGGFNVLMDFEKGGKVRMLTDFLDEESNTTYSFNASQGAVMSFDTYSCLHYLADPSNTPKGQGWEGEFEFMIQDITADSIVFLGKKHGYKAVFLPAQAEDWTDLLPAAKKNLEHLRPQDNAPFFRSLTMNATAVNLVYNPTTRAASVTWADPVNKKTETFLTAVYGTKEGVAFMPALRINGVVVEELKYNEAKDGFVVGTPGVIGELKYSDYPPIPFYNSYTELSTTSNSAALPLIGGFSLSINAILEVMNVTAGMGQMSADLKPSYPLAVIAGLKQFRISWNSPTDGMPEGQWLTFFGATNLFREGEFFYHESIKGTSLREEGDQVRFELQKGINAETGEEETLTFQTDSTFTARMQLSGFTTVVRKFFVEPQGFTVVPAGNDKFYFVSIADSKRWMLLSKN